MGKNVILTYYKYLGDNTILFTTLEALCNTVKPFEDSWEESVLVTEVELIEDGDHIIHEDTKNIGCVVGGNFVRLK